MRCFFIKKKEGKEKQKRGEKREEKKESSPKREEKREKKREESSHKEEKRKEKERKTSSIPETKEKTRTSPIPGKKREKNSLTYTREGKKRKASPIPGNASYIIMPHLYLRKKRREKKKLTQLYEGRLCYTWEKREEKKSEGVGLCADSWIEEADLLWYNNTIRAQKKAKNRAKLHTQLHTRAREWLKTVVLPLATDQGVGSSNLLTHGSKIRENA